MRALCLLKGDFRFQRKYGIFAVYVVFILLYVAVIRALPDNISAPVGIILVYTDPAAMGLFFMGAVVLLEKSQRINCSLAVTPVKISEYIMSKAVSFMVMGLIAGLLILIPGGLSITPLYFPAIGLSSVLFSLCGLFAACKSESLNQFVIISVPFEMFICLPAILFMVTDLKSPWWILNPGVAAVRMLTEESRFMSLCILSLLVWGVLAYMACHRAVKKMFCELGGGSL